MRPDRATTDHARLNADERAWDVVVIGAGVAGAAAAIRLATAAPGEPARRVLLLERSPWPRDKACGGCLNAGAARELDELGVGRRVRERSAAIERVAIRCGTREAELRHAGGLAIDRRTLDALLVDAAIERGVEFAPGCRATVEPRVAGLWPVRVRRGGIESALRAVRVLVADGLAGGAIAPGVLGAHDDAEVDPRGRVGVATVVPARRAWPGVIRMHVARHGYVGVVDLAEGRHAVAAAIEPEWCRTVGGPRSAIMAVLESCRAADDVDLGDAPLWGTPRLTRRRRAVAAPGLFVLGDAAGYIEPFTGEGMGWALRWARAAVELARRGDDEPAHDHAARAWQAFHDGPMRARRRGCTLVRGLVRRPGVASLALRALGAGTLVRRAAELLASRVFGGLDPLPAPTTPRILGPHAGEAPGMMGARA